MIELIKLQIEKNYMCGIDNHEINDVSSVIAGEVTQTTVGEVITILNQYTYHIHSSR